MYVRSRDGGGGGGSTAPARPWRSAAGARAGALVAAAAAALLSACVAGETSGSVLRVEAVATGLGAADVARVTVTVGPGGGEPFTPFEAVATRQGDRWELVIGQVPLGPQRQLDVRALDGAGQVILAGGARADLLPGVGATVVVVLQEVAAPPPDATSAPVLRSLVVWGPIVPPGESAVLQATAEAAPGDELYFLWSTTDGCGYFDDIEAPATRWWALGVSAGDACWLSLTVANGSGNSVRVGVPVLVQAPAP